MTCPACGTVVRPRSPAAANHPAPEITAEAFLPTDLTPLDLRRSATRRSVSWGRLLVVFLVVGALMGGVALAVWRSRSLWVEAKKQGPDGTTLLFVDLNCQYIAPGPPWQPDDEVKQGLRALVALKRPEPETWLAFFAQDYRDRVPGAGQVRDEAVRRLNVFFRENLEWEQGDDVTLAGLPAQRLTFRGETDRGGVSGECTMLVHTGVAYWLLTWAPDTDITKARRDFDALRGRFSLSGKRASGSGEASGGVRE